MSRSRGSVITRSAHSRYAGLLPIEPSSHDFLRPIDLEPEYVWFPNGQPSARKRPRWLARFLIAFCPGVAAILLWQSYGWLAQRPGLTAQNPHPPDVIERAAPAAPFAEKFKAISFDLDAVGQNKTAITIPAGQAATSVDQAVVAKASGVTVESQGDAAASQQTVPLNIKPTEAKPPEMLSEKGKPLAARPRGSDHRRERVARKEMAGTTENGLAAPLAPGRQGWSFGLP
jgi:hypothetical protein